MANYLGSLPGQDEALTNNPGSNLDSFYTDENWILESLCRQSIKGEP